MHITSFFCFPPRVIWFVFWAHWLSIRCRSEALSQPLATVRGRLLSCRLFRCCWRPVLRRSSEAHFFLSAISHVIVSIMSELIELSYLFVANTPPSALILSGHKSSSVRLSTLLIIPLSPWSSFPWSWPSLALFWTLQTSFKVPKFHFEAVRWIRVILPSWALFFRLLITYHSGYHWSLIILLTVARFWSLNFLGLFPVFLSYQARPFYQSSICRCFPDCPLRAWSVLLTVWFPYLSYWDPPSTSNYHS